MKKLETCIQRPGAGGHINTKISMVFDVIRSLGARLKKIELATNPPKTG